MLQDDFHIAFLIGLPVTLSRPHAPTCWRSLFWL